MQGLNLRPLPCEGEYSQKSATLSERKRAADGLGTVGIGSGMHRKCTGGRVLKLADVKWSGDGLTFDCPDCGCETQFGELAPRLRCCHCETVYQLPRQIEVKPVREKAGVEIAEGC